MASIYVGGCVIVPSYSPLLAGEVSDLPEVREPCSGEQYTSDQVAEYFHRTYERLAEDFGYKTREESRVPWGNISPNHRQLMRAVALEVMKEFFPSHVLWQ